MKRLMVAVALVALALLADTVCAPRERTRGPAVPRAGSEAPPAAAPEAVADDDAPGGEARAVAGGATGTAPAAELVHRLRVEVVDRAGRAVGAVAVAAFEPELDTWRSFGEATTDDLGRAAFDVRDRPRVRVATVLERCSPELVEVTLAAWPAEPVRLVVEDTGAIEVRASDVEGRPLGAPVTLSLATDEDAPIAWPFALGLHQRVRLPGSDGRARFERVGLGLAFVADAELEGAVFTSRWVAGPRAAGELVRVDVPLDRTDSLLRATFVDEQGAPLAHWTWDVWLRRGDSQDSSAVERFESDAAGRAQAYVSTGYRDLSAVGGVTFVGRKPNELGRRASCALPRATRAASGVPRDEYDFGTLECGLDPLYCAGRVVDEQGTPVADAKLHLMLGSVEWSEVRDYREDADALGRFVVAWPGRSGKLVLVAEADRNRRSDPRVVARGEREVVLVVPSAASLGGLAGRILLPPGVTTDDFDVSIERVLDDGTRVPCGFDLGSAGSFQVERTPAGEYAVTVAWTHSDEPLAEVRGLEVRGGEATRAAPIDLRDRVHALRVELVDAGGTPLPEGSVCELRDGEVVRSAHAGPDGVAVLPLSTPTCDVVASAPGCRPAQARGVSGSTRLELAPGFIARLRGPALGSDAGDFELRLNLWFAGPESEACFQRSVACVLDAQGRGSATFGLAGAYELGDARLVQRVTGAEFPLALDPPPTLELGEDGREHLVELRSEALAAALAAATKR